MEKTLEIINEMQVSGLIQNYALGGGIALLFYTEPILTYDLDVFVFLPNQDADSKQLVTLTPIYNYLQSKGYKPQEEHVVIEGVPVQFIPVYNKLIEEAVREAVETKVT